jgi:hypothetical protein
MFVGSIYITHKKISRFPVQPSHTLCLIPQDKYTFELAGGVIQKRYVGCINMPLLSLYNASISLDALLILHSFIYACKVSCKAIKEGKQLVVFYKSLVLVFGCGYPHWLFPPKC